MVPPRTVRRGAAVLYPPRVKITVEHLWDGSPAAADERVAITLRATDAAGTLQIEVEAPFHGDPPPPHAAGATPGLWNHEVVELFLYGADGRYLEVELGPHGHHLVLELRGVRQVTRQGLVIAFDREIVGARWHGRASIPGALIPAGTDRLNAHAIHGVGEDRRYLSAFAAGGARPDFHRPDVAGPIEPGLLAELGGPLRAAVASGT